MSKQLWAFDTQTRQRPLHPCMRSGLLALVAALQCAPLLAGEVGEGAGSRATSAAQEEITWMSGGVGDDARDEMRKMAAHYNVHVVFSSRDGAYLAGIPFSVNRRDGRQIYSGVSEGPLLYLNLPPGRYQVSATLDGGRQSKLIRAGTSSHPARISFVARGD